MYVDRFGWIPRPLDLEGSFGQLRTLSDFDDAVATITRRADYEGYVYPSFENVGAWREPHEASNAIDHVTRPEKVHKLQATHELSLTAASDDPAILRNADSGFLIHFLGFLFGYRCQFWEWWVDLRISVQSQADYYVASPDGIGKCLDLGLSSWREWEQPQRTVFINAMFLHNRSSGYLWEWERFQAEYQVFDAFYAVARSRFIRPNKKEEHSKRIEISCKHFGLYWNPDLVKDIVDYRNNLIHEARWGGRMPGTARDEKTFYLPIWLHKMNQRFGLAILGFTNDYIRSSWTRLGTNSFTI